MFDEQICTSPTFVDNGFTHNKNLVHAGCPNSEIPKCCHVANKNALLSLLHIQFCTFFVRYKDIYAISEDL